MKELLLVDRFDQAEALFKPQRVEVLRQLAEPRSCTEVGAVLGQSAQRVYYPVQRLRDAGLIDRVDERRVHGISEGIYQAVARSYWLSPRLVGPIGGRGAQDQLSLGYLLNLVEDVQTDLVRLEGRSVGDLSTLGVSGEIRLPPASRKAFLDDLRSTLQDLFARHGGSEGEVFRLAVACYLKESPDE
jgi:DNA-binding transcriptional ArsR family regulator